MLLQAETCVRRCQIVGLPLSQIFSCGDAQIDDLQRQSNILLSHYRVHISKNVGDSVQFILYNATPTRNLSY